MSERKKIIENNEDKKDNIDIIEEKVGNTNVPFSEVFKLYTERILDKGEDDLFRDDDLIDLDITEKNKFEIKGSIGSNLIYDGEMVFFPILVSFEKDDIIKHIKFLLKNILIKYIKE